MKRSSLPIGTIYWMLLRWAWGEGETQSWAGGVAFGVPSLTCTYLSFLGKLDFRCSSARSLDLMRKSKRNCTWMYGERGVCPSFSIPWSTVKPFPVPFLSSLLSQMIPHQGSRGGWCAPLLGLMITTKNRTFIVYQVLCFRFRVVTLIAILKSKHYLPWKD